MKESTRLRADLKQVTDLLEQMNERSFLERLSLEGRRDDLEKRIRALGPEQVKKQAILTFRGRPVVRSEGISADFAGRATSAFMDAYQAVVAGLKSTLSYMGPIPDRGLHDLKIISTATGSFGFQFELPPTEQDLFEKGRSVEEEAFDTLQELMRESATGSDERVLEIIERVHPRAVRKLHDFLEVMEQNEAWCGVEFDGDIFRFEGLDAVTQSVARLSDENIDERDVEFQGEFQGVLPKGRTFEFRVFEGDQIIKGRVSEEIEDPDELNRSWLHRPIRVKFHVVQFGQAKPRYLLVDLPNQHS
jgi:hypothetical protein